MRMLKLPTHGRMFIFAALFDAIGLGVIGGAIAPFAGVLARRMGATDVQLALMTSAPFIGFFAALLLNRLAYRMRWGRLMTVVRVLGYLGLLALVAKRTPSIFVLVIGWSMFAAAFARPLLGALFKVNVEEKERPAVLQWLRILPVLIAPPVAWVCGKLLDSPDEIGRIKLLIPAVGAGAIVTSLLFFFIPSSKEEQQHHEAEGPGLLAEWRLLMRHRELRLFLGVFFIGTLAEKIVLPITPIYFADILALDYAALGLIMGVVGPVMGLLGYAFWGWRLRHVSPLQVLTWCMVLKVARPVLWALAAGQEDAVMLVIIGEAVYRLMFAGLEAGALLAVLSMCGKDDAPLCIGLHYLFIGVRGLLGPVIGLLLYRIMPVPAIYWTVAVLVLIGAAALALYARRQPADA
jgi:hypothetical protein